MVSNVIFPCLSICQSDEYFEFLHVFQKYFYLSHYFCDLCSCVCVCVSVFHMTGFIKLILKGLFDLISSMKKY